MKVSWNWLSTLVDLSAVGTPEKLAEILTGLGLEVEAVNRQGAGFEQVVSARVVKKEKHPGADRLNLCQVDSGDGKPLQIVCGAHNFKEGDVVCLAQVGAKLPNGMQIKAGKIRDVLSNGMLCSEEELALAAKSEGILVLPAGTPLGKPVAEILGRDDTTLELKLTPNRGDCLSLLGVAREVAAFTGAALKAPLPKGLPAAGASPISTALEAGEFAPQFLGCFIRGVRVGPSPDWVRKRLEAMGARSISNVVDATNLVLYELGQPVHAYDAKRLEGKQLRVRMSRAGEELPLLDGTTVKLTGEELVIADEKKPVSLAGVMGGGNSEVTEATVDVFLECAEFDPVKTRRAASRFVKHTDSSHRFERGVNPEGQRLALARLAGLVTELAGGAVVGVAEAVGPARGAGLKRAQVELEPAFIGRFLGLEIPDAEVERVLSRLGCAIEKSGAKWQVTPPAHRLDLSIREDFAEEVARFLGYDRIPSTIPALTNAPTSLLDSPAAQSFEALERVKDILASQGLRETVSYSFTSREWLAKFGLESSLTLINPLSSDQEAMTPSLVPGLVAAALENQRKHFGSEALELRLFEVRPSFQGPGAGTAVHSKSRTDTGVTETWRLAFALSGTRYQEGLQADRKPLDFYDLKAQWEQLVERLGARGVRLTAMGEGSRLPADPRYGMFHPGQSVAVLGGKEVIGAWGLLHPRIAKELKLRAPLWIGEVDWDALRKLARFAPREFKAWGEHPGMERDFALLVRDGIDADKITQVALAAGKPLAKVVRVFDIYRGSPVPEGMTSIAVRVIFLDDSRSLQEAEADEVSGKILARWKSELGIDLRG
ncbi:MAG: phenylalanine--tRNA ligase subunit beta [Bdellovibrionales bacterium]|nr:phenylalanine--tRNA ligase subunit beta [Bdellovibrionales bacterium]